MADIKLGDEVEDVVAKVRGIAHGRVEYLDGSVYWIIQPPADAGVELAKEVHSQAGYCVKVGDGVYMKPKPPLGFVASEVNHGKK